MKTVLAIRIATATVWLVFGLVFKVFDVVPRHRSIVASILGEQWAGPITVLVGVAETALGIWILTGLFPRLCATVQTVALVSMNSLEIYWARDLLLAPVAMVCANILFLGLVWYSAIKTSERSSALSP